MLDYGNPATSAVGRSGFVEQRGNKYEINILSQSSLAPRALKILEFRHYPCLENKMIHIVMYSPISTFLSLTFLAATISFRISCLFDFPDPLALVDYSQPLYNFIFLLAT